MINFDTLIRIKDITAKDNHSDETLFLHLSEEVGELAAAMTIEDGVKNKPLNESAKMEAVDTIICALSLYFRRGGKMSDLDEFLNKKLDKWKARL